MWPNGALADILVTEVKGSPIEDSMYEYTEYLSQLGLNCDKWSIDDIARHLEKPDREVRDLLQAMLHTDWASEFDRMHEYIEVTYGPELADLFNLYNFLNVSSAV